MKLSRAKNTDDQRVLIGVVKGRRDLGYALRDRWYRIPVAHAPSRVIGYLAFYPPQAFGRRGGTIRYVAPVLGRTTARRRDLIPAEPGHPRAGDMYRRYALGNPIRLPHPVSNLAPRRVTFAFTTLRRLFEAHDILDIFGVPPIERMLGRALTALGVQAFPEFTVSFGDGKRCRLDFAVFCARGPLAVECDGAEYHSSPGQRSRDRARDARLRKAGWTVLRLKEKDIVADPANCARRVRAACRRLGGTASTG